MKQVRFFFALWALFMTPAALFAEAGDPARIFIEAVKSYDQGDYAAAAAGFLSVSEGGVVNGNLYYNIANAFFKAGDIGRAVLWYEKAYRLIPDDPDVKFNLEYARSLVRDKSPEDTVSLADLFFWRFWLGRKIVAGLAACFSLLFCLALFLKKKINKGVPSFVIYGAFCLFFFFTLTATGNYFFDYRNHQGVVLAESVSVKSGFSDLSTELFVLHAGSRVTIEQEQKDFYRIRFGKDKTGWVNQKEIGVI